MIKKFARWLFKRTHHYDLIAVETKSNVLARHADVTDASTLHNAGRAEGIRETLVELGLTPVID